MMLAVCPKTSASVEEHSCCRGPDVCTVRIAGGFTSDQFLSGAVDWIFISGWSALSEHLEHIFWFGFIQKESSLLSETVSSYKPKLSVSPDDQEIYSSFEL